MCNCDTSYWCCTKVESLRVGMPKPLFKVQILLHELLDFSCDAVHNHVVLFAFSLPIPPLHSELASNFLKFILVALLDVLLAFFQRTYFVVEGCDGHLEGLDLSEILALLDRRVHTAIDKLGVFM